MKNEVHLIDCNKYMAGVPDGFFDLCICDPPYGIEWMNTITKKIDEKKRKQNKHLSGYRIDKNLKLWDKKPPPKEYFIELFRISKYQIIWGGNYFIDNLYPSKCWIVWDKVVKFSTNNPEMAWTNFRKGISIFQYAPNMERILNINKKDDVYKKIHSCQKPIALYKWILQNYAKPGWKIFDSHVGSGSIRVACHDLGFDFTGCELDPDYHRDQEERFRNHIANPELFDKQEIQENIFQQGVLV